MPRLATRLLWVWMALAGFLALWPFTFSWQCLICENGAAVDPQAGQLIFPQPGLARTSMPGAVNRILSENDLLVVEMWLMPANVRQAGPARIVSYSSGPFRRNFTVGQEEDGLVLRLRTDAANENGRREEMHIDGVFSPNRRTHIVITYDRGATFVAVDSADPVPIGDTRIDFTSWSADFDLIIGNESTGGRPWLGSLERIVIRSAPTETTLVDLDFRQQSGPSDAMVAAEDLRFPRTIIPIPTLREEHFLLEDLVLHFAMTFPIGFLCMLIFSRTRDTGRVVMLSMTTVVLFAAIIELLQHLSVTRTMSMLDLFWGLIGGVFGIWGSTAVLRRS